ncbi:MAG: transposase family protein, partial [Proteobacteria bacterium]|nr:transposase family protein [Pseudomonadota bacterium]
MKNVQSQLDEPSNEALFRYQVLSQVFVQEHKGEKRSRAIKAVAAKEHVSVDGKYRTICGRTIYRWLNLFEMHGFSGLIPAQRVPSQGSAALPRPLIDFIADQKTADPLASVPELIRRATLKGIITPDQNINRVTAWRTLKRMGIDVSRRKTTEHADQLRFSYPHRMQMVLCDGKHFRVGEGRLRRVALFFLDDSSRMGLHVVVGSSENKELFLRGLYETILSYGLMDALFVDNGSGFKANDAIEVLRKLNVLFIHGTAGYAEGHGKIERFNRTVKEQVIRLFNGNPEIDPDCAALELRLRHYLHQMYNLSPHESLDKNCPWSCFHDDK